MIEPASTIDEGLPFTTRGGVIKREAIFPYLDEHRRCRARAGPGEEDSA